MRRLNTSAWLRTLSAGMWTWARPSGRETRESSRVPPSTKPLSYFIDAEFSNFKRNLQSSERTMSQVKPVLLDLLKETLSSIVVLGNQLPLSSQEKEPLRRAYKELNSFLHTLSSKEISSSSPNPTAGRSSTSSTLISPMGSTLTQAMLRASKAMKAATKTPKSSSGS